MIPALIVDLLDKVEREEILEEILTDSDKVEDLLVTGNVTSIYDPEYLDSYLDAFIPAVEKILERKVKPMYSYVRIHHNGSELQPHIDREEVHYSLSVPIRFDDPWTICFQPPDTEDNHYECGSIPVGHGLLFTGNEYRHARPAFQGEEYVLVMFMYCDDT